MTRLLDQPIDSHVALGNGAAGAAYRTVVLEYDRGRTIAVRWRAPDSNPRQSWLFRCDVHGEQHAPTCEHSTYAVARLVEHLFAVPHAAAVAKIPEGLTA